MRLRRRRRRSERQHAPAVLVRSAVVLAMTAALMYIALTATGGLPGESHYRLTAEFADAKNIVKNSEVWIAGRSVGTVRGGDASGHTSRLDLQLDAGVEPLPADTTARLRYTSLLGALVVELTPGRSPEPLPDGGTIVADRTSSADQLADVLTALDDKRRPELRTTVRELGVGFHQQGLALNQTIAKAPGVLDDARRFSTGVLARGDAAERFFGRLEQLSSAADPVREDIARGFEPEARVLDALERPSVERVLQTAPPSLEGVRTGLRQTDPLLVQAEGFSRAALAAVGPAVPSLSEGRALLREAREPLRDLRGVLVSAREAVDPVLGFTRPAERLAPRLEEGLRAPQSFFAEFNPHRCDFETWARNWRSLLAYTGIGSPVPDTDVGPLTGLRVQVQQLGTDQQVLGRDPVNRRGINAYPEPCRSYEDEVGR